MTNFTQHWNKIFEQTDTPQLGWFEADLAESLAYLAQTDLSSNSSVFMPGAGTSTLVDWLYQSGCRLLLNDISDSALRLLKQRLLAATPSSSQQQSSPVFFQHDMGAPIETASDHALRADIWIDRAVLHFLLTESQIDNYFNTLKQCLRSGGYALFAEFTVDGATQCAGLKVKHYRVEDFSARLGAEFNLVAHKNVTFVNPFGAQKPYVYALYQRQSG